MKTFTTILLSLVLAPTAAFAMTRTERLQRRCLAHPALQWNAATKKCVSRPIGGQKDAHGCLIPAGYSWCAAKAKCLRTWEETCPGISSASSSSRSSTSSVPCLGCDRDVHGCIGSAGYSWCAAKQKCLRPWEETCS